MIIYVCINIYKKKREREEKRVKLEKILIQLSCHSFIFFYTSRLKLFQILPLLYAILILWEEPRYGKKLSLPSCYSQIFILLLKTFRQMKQTAQNESWRVPLQKKKKKIDARRLSKSGELMQRNQTAICRWLSISCTIKTR